MGKEQVVMSALHFLEPFPLLWGRCGIISSWAWPKVAATR